MSAKGVRSKGGEKERTGGGGLLCFGVCKRPCQSFKGEREVDLLVLALLEF